MRASPASSTSVVGRLRSGFTIDLTTVGGDRILVAVLTGRMEQGNEQGDCRPGGAGLLGAVCG